MDEHVLVFDQTTKHLTYIQLSYAIITKKYFGEWVNPTHHWS